MGESEIKASLVRRYAANKVTEDELDVFFYMLKEGELDLELGSYMDAEMIRQLRTAPAPVYWVPKRKNIWSWKIAASLTIILGAGILAYLHRPDFFWDQANMQYSYISTGRGEVKKITLADGSQIWLNASSQVKFPNHFADNIRELFLVDGEAYFNVKKDVKRPFVVHAAGTRTKVLGTEFNVRSYRYLASVQVTVSRGKVSVATEKKQNPDSVLLLPNQRASFDRHNKITFEDQINAGNAMAWKQGRMIFDNELLTDVAVELEQKYRVQIEVAEPKAAKIRLTAEFDASGALSDVLEALSLANNLTYTQKEDTVILKLKR